MNQVKLARQWISNFIRSNDFNKYGNINHIVYAKKESGGVEQDEYAIRLYVDKKRPLSEIPLEERIPTSIEYSGAVILTDVDDRKLNIKQLTDCHTLQTTSSAAQPVKANNIKRRPLMGGASSIYIGGTDATLGMLVRDLTDGSIVALSNNHVYGSSFVNASEFTPGDIENLLSLSASQPGSAQYNYYASSNVMDDYIGMTKRAIPFTFLSYNYADAALVQLQSNTLIDTISSPNIINFKQQAPYTVASEDEIDSILLPGSVNYGAPLFKSGRTTGPVGAPGTLSACSFGCVGTGCSVLCATGVFTGGIGFGIGSINFTDCIQIQSAYRNFVPVRGGDSGSATFALLSANNPVLSAWKFIGLVFAGSSSPTNAGIGIVCRAEYILSGLDIGMWDTTMPELCSLPLNVTYTDYTVLSAPTITLSGRKYYQMGIPN